MSTTTAPVQFEDDELPPCIGERMRDVARGYDKRQRDAAEDQAGGAAATEARW